MKIRRFQSKDENNLKELFGQLTKDQIKLNAKEMVRDRKTFCFVVEEKEKIIGSGTLAVFRNPVRGMTGIVENVIVDEKNRGKGLGKKIMDKIFSVAKKQKLEEIVLISNPEREVARKMYQALGFKLLKTGFFRKELN